MFYIKYKYKLHQDISTQLHSLRLIGQQNYKNLHVKGREKRVRIGNDC